MKFNFKLKNILYRKNNSNQNLFNKILYYQNQTQMFFENILGKGKKNPKPKPKITHLIKQNIKLIIKYFIKYSEPPSIINIVKNNTQTPKQPYLKISNTTENKTQNQKSTHIHTKIKKSITLYICMLKYIFNINQKSFMFKKIVFIGGKKYEIH